MQRIERRRDHNHITLQLEHQVQQQSSLRKLCSSGLLAFAAVSAPIALFFLSSSSLAAGSVFARKTALFLLSNAIFLLLAADCRCTATATALRSAVPASGALEKQEARRQRQVEPERCAVVSSCVVVPCSASVGHGDQEGEEKQKPAVSAESRADEEHDGGDVAAVVSKLDELVVGHAAQEDSVALDLETLGVGEAACGGGGGVGVAQELDRLEIHELNKKFDDFIQSRKTKWMEEEDDEEEDDDEEEEASLLLQHV